MQLGIWSYIPVECNEALIIVSSDDNLRKKKKEYDTKNVTGDANKKWKAHILHNHI